MGQAGLRCVIYFSSQQYLAHSPDLHSLYCIVLLHEVQYSRVIAESRTSRSLVHFGPRPGVLQPVRHENTPGRKYSATKNIDDRVLGVVLIQAI